MFFLIGVGSCLGNGLLNQTDLIENALVLGTHYKSLGTVQWIFPDIQFTCDTVVTSISYATFTPTTGRSENPIFQTWRKRHSAGSLTYDRTNEVSGNSRALDGVNTYVYSNLQWRVEDGDILGAYQPDRTRSTTYLSFQNDLGPSSYFKKVSLARRDAPFNVSSASQVADIPLVSIEATGEKQHLQSSKLS